MLLERKEHELLEVEQSLHEERLINMSHNSAVEEMSRLILQIVEENDTLHATGTANGGTGGKPDVIGRIEGCDTNSINSCICQSLPIFHCQARYSHRQSSYPTACYATRL